MKNLWILSLLILLILLNAPLFAQAPNMKWGRYSKDDVRMKSYDLDKNADAVILAHRTNARYEIRDGEEVILYTKYVRIKILTKDGLKRARVKIPYTAFDEEETISSLKAQSSTYRSGRLAVDRLPKSKIRTQRIDKFISQKNFVLPRVRVGSIIEYRYTMVSKDIRSIQKHYFQHDMPVIWSEFNLKVPEFCTYAALKKIDRSFAVEAQKTIKYELGNDYEVRSGAMYTWAIQNVPALKEHQYMTTPADYRQSIGLELKEYISPIQDIQQYFTTWEDAKRQLMKDEDFGQKFNNSTYIQSVAKASEAVLNKNMSEQEKANVIFDFVKKNIKWDGNYAIYADRAFDEIFTAHTGSIAEINLTLLALLKNVGIKAHPVLLSSRQHGQINTAFPILKQFNYVVVQALIGKKTILLDASHPLLPLGLVQFEALNQNGWLLSDSTNGQWIKILPKTHKQIQQIDINITANGSASGSIKTYNSGYAGVEERNNYLQYSPRTYAESLFSISKTAIRVDTFFYKNIDKLDKPFVSTLYFKADDWATLKDGTILLSPFILKSWDEHPFSEEERLVPTDFGYTTSQQTIININLPDGYTIEEMPKGLRISLLENAGSYSIQFGKNPNGSTQIISRLNLNEAIYPVSAYPFLKSFVGMVVEKQDSELTAKMME